MKRTITAISVCWCLSPSVAWAVDWSANSTLSETVEFNDNLYLRSMLAGGPFANSVLGSYSTISANATARTPTSTFNFDGSISYRKYVGPGTEGQSSTESLSGNLHGHYETRGEVGGDRNYLDVGWSRQNTALALLSDLGVTTPVSGSIDRTTIGGGIDRALSRLDTVSFSARSSLNTYEPASAGTEFTDTSGNATWRHKVSSIASINVSSDIELLNYQTLPSSRLLIARETAGLDLSLSPVLSLRGNAGIVYLKADGGVSTVPLLGTGTAPTVGGNSASASGFIFNAALTYKMFKTTTLTLSAVRSVSPSVIGSINELTSVHAGINHAVNSRSSLSFGSDISQQTSSGTTSELFSASVAYSYMLTKEWSAQFSYRYLHRFASSGSSASGLTVDPLTGIPIFTGTGPANSNSILLVVSRSVSLLPDGY